MIACRSGSDSLPSGFPLGGRGAPAAADGVLESCRAPHVTKNSSVEATDRHDKIYKISFYLARKKHYIKQLIKSIYYQFKQNIVF